MKRPPVVQKSLLRHQAADLLRQQIVDGDLRAGEHLLELALADSLQISRGPVREALLQLEAEGLVRSDPHRGFHVIETDFEYVQELYEYRAMLEGFAAETVARIADDDLITDLSSLLEEMERMAAAGKIRDMLDLDLRFHERIVEAAARERVLRSWLLVKSQVALVVHATSDAIAGRLQHPAALHADIVHALRNRDSVAARSAAVEHVLRVTAIVAKQPQGADVPTE